MRNPKFVRWLTLAIAVILAVSLVAPALAAEPKAADCLISTENFTLYPKYNDQVKIENGKIVTSSDRRFLAMSNFELKDNYSFTVEINPTNGLLEHFIGLHVSDLPIDTGYDGGFDWATGYGVFLGEVDQGSGEFSIRMVKVNGGFKGWIFPQGRGEDLARIKGVLAGMQDTDTLTVKITEINGIVTVQVWQTNDPTKCSEAVSWDLETETLEGQVKDGGRISLNANGWFTGEQYSNLKVLYNEDAKAPVAAEGTYTIHTSKPEAVKEEGGKLITSENMRFLAEYSGALPKDYHMQVQVYPNAEGYMEHFIGLHASGIPTENYDGGWDWATGYGVFLGNYNKDTDTFDLRINKVNNGFKGWLVREYHDWDVLPISGMVASLGEGESLTVDIVEINGIVTVQVWQTKNPANCSIVAVWDLKTETLEGEVPESDGLALNVNGWFTGTLYSDLKIEAIETNAPLDMITVAPPANRDQDVKADPLVSDTESWKLYSTNGNTHASIVGGWVTTDSDNRFLALYNKSLGQEFTFSVDINPVDGYLENFIGIHMSNIADNYDAVDFCTGYAILLCDANAESGNVTVRMSKVNGGFKGFMPANGDKDCVVVEGILKHDGKLSAKVSVKGTDVTLWLYNSSDPEKLSDPITFDLTKAPVNTTYDDPLPLTGKVALAHNGWKTGAHYGNVAIEMTQEDLPPVEGNPSTGDTSALLMLVSLVCVSLCGLAVTHRKKAF